MNSLLSVISVSAGAFISTNLDDICLLILFFSMLKEKRQTWFVIAGEYLDIATLCILSLLISKGAALILGKYIWIVGFVPLGFGIKSLIGLIRKKEDAVFTMSAEGTWMLIFAEWAVTVSNGGDNLSIYIPLLGNLGLGTFHIFFIVMMAMTTLWWILALTLRGIPAVSDVFSKAGKYILPVVFLLVGAATIIKGLA